MTGPRVESPGRRDQQQYFRGKTNSGIPGRVPTSKFRLYKHTSPCNHKIYKGPVNLLLKKRRERDSNPSLKAALHLRFCIYEVIGIRLGDLCFNVKLSYE